MLIMHIEPWVVGTIRTLTADESLQNAVAEVRFATDHVVVTTFLI